MSQESDEWVEQIVRRLRCNDVSLGELDIDGSQHILETFHWTHILDSLRYSNKIIRVAFKNLEIDASWAHLLAASLQRMKCLEVLQFDNCDDVDGILLDSICVALLNKQSFHTLHVKDFSLPEHCRALGILSGYCRFLTEVRLNHSSLDISASHLLSLGLAARDSSLEMLDLTGCDLTDEAIMHLSRGMLRNRSMRHLVLDFNSFGDKGVQHLSRTLSQSSCTLHDLHLFGNSISADGAEYLADALLHNKSLRSLILSFNQIGDRGVAALAAALTKNTTLKNLWFPSNSVGCQGFLDFASQLPAMKGLEQLDVGLLLEEEAAEALTCALQRNLRLSTLHMETMDSLCDEEAFSEEGVGVGNSSRHGKELDFYLRLNKSGRRLLLREEEKQASPGLWAQVFAQSNNHRREDGAPDVLFYLLKEKAAELLNTDYAGAT